MRSLLPAGGRRKELNRVALVLFDIFIVNSSADIELQCAYGRFLRYIAKRVVTTG